ncbi:hypothetical protein BG004_006474 [Podila humilis]|nr:hypothetical protein BG004_006474 [Podila humilis]
MIHAGTRPVHWSALGSLAALMILQGATAQIAPCAAVTVTQTKTETTTVWADGSWPTSTVTQLVLPDNCPPEPRYSCYVVTTTTVSSAFPQATIHMVLPQTGRSLANMKVGHEDNINLSENEDNSDIDEVAYNNEVDDNGDRSFDESENQNHAGGQEKYPALATPTVKNMLPAAPPAGPACVHYVTTLELAPCATFSPLPLNSDGCAIITSTSVALTTATAVPDRGRHQNDIEETFIYSMSIGHNDPDPAPTGHHKKHHRVRLHKHDREPHIKHHSPVTSEGHVADTSITPAPAPVASPAVPVPLPTVVSKVFTASLSTHYSYSISFEFNYGTAIPPPPLHSSQKRTTTLRELAAPSLTSAISSPTIMPPALPPPPPPPPSSSSSSSSLSSESTTPDPIAAPSPVPLPEPVPEDKTNAGPPVAIPPSHPPSEVGYKVAEVSDPTEDSTTTIAVPPDTAPRPVPNNGAVVGLDVSMGGGDGGEKQEHHKAACEVCAEPCIVDVKVVVSAEIPLLEKLFQEKIKKALASLKLSIENETGVTPKDSVSIVGGRRGLLASLLSVDVSTNSNDDDDSDDSDDSGGGGSSKNRDMEMTELFKKTCDDKLQALEDKHVAAVKTKCEQIIQSRCESGECLQSEVDRAVRWLDVMISAELAKDCSQLRVELVHEFKSRCVEADNNQNKNKNEKKKTEDTTAEAVIEKKVEQGGGRRGGGGLLGSILGGQFVDSVGDVVEGSVKAVSLPPLGEVVKEVVDALTITVKGVVDSFVGNCNRKGLLDFDTEIGVGSLKAIQNVSLELAKIVCVQAEVDVQAKR